MEKWVFLGTGGEFEDCNFWQLTVDGLRLIQLIPVSESVPDGSILVLPIRLFFEPKQSSSFEHWFALMTLAVVRKQSVFFKDSGGVHRMDITGKIVTLIHDGEEDTIPVVFR